MDKDKIAIKKELITERYNLNFVEDVYGMMPPKEGERRSTRSYETFKKVEPRLYKGTASLYSNADKKFYKFSYVFDDEGIFLQENVEAENKSPDDFLKDKATVNNK